MSLKERARERKSEGESEGENSLRKITFHFIRFFTRFLTPFPFPPELSEDQDEEVDLALRGRSPDAVLSEGFRLQITRRDMATLLGLNWLNDEVIFCSYNGS